MKISGLMMFIFGFCCCLVLMCLLDSSGSFLTGFVISDYSGDAPGDWIGEEDILLFDDEIILKVANATLSRYEDSGSMLPFLDEGANGIRIVPVDEDDVDVGDIVSYRIGNLLVVHRVVEKGVDEDGVYFVMKGDGNFFGDGRIRFEDIEYVTVGIIY